MKITLPDANAYGGAVWDLVYPLPEGQPVEFRVDLVSANDRACVGRLAIAMQPLLRPDFGQGYIVEPYHGWVFLAKFVYPAVWCDSFGAGLPSETEPVTMSLTLTRRGDSSNLGVKVVLREEPTSVLFEGEVTDDPEPDPATGGTDPGPPLRGAVVAVGLAAGANPDMSGSRGLVCDNLACSEDPVFVPWVLEINRQGDGGMRLDWEGLGCIPLAADSIQGPWKPWPGPIDDSGPFSANIAFRATGQFFRLVAGSHMKELFDSEIVFWETCAVTGGGGQRPEPLWVRSRGCRIQGTGENNQDFLLTLVESEANSCYQDRVASVDIAIWGTTIEDATFGIILRAKPVGGPLVVRQRRSPQGPLRRVDDVQEVWQPVGVAVGPHRATRRSAGESECHRRAKQSPWLSPRGPMLALHHQR